MRACVYNIMYYTKNQKVWLCGCVLRVDCQACKNQACLVLVLFTFNNSKSI